MAYEEIESITVRYKNGRLKTFDGKGAVNVYKAKQKVRMDEGFGENRDFFVEIVQVQMLIGEVPAPRA